MDIVKTKRSVIKPLLISAKAAPTLLSVAAVILLFCVVCTRSVDGRYAARPLNSFFPDAALAECVANAMGIDPEDRVTEEFLASFDGALICSGIELKSLDGIGLLKGLTSLTCCKNRVTELPAEIGSLTRLKTLDCRKAFELSTVPREIGCLSSLTSLDLSFTCIECLPDEICRLSDLTYFSAAVTGIRNLPSDIGDLTSLRVLDVHLTRLTSLPDRICDIPSLEEVNVSYCPISKTPECLDGILINEQITE